MDTSIQNYFWLVDRLSMEDDSRNKVNAETETVTLSENLAREITDGQIFGKLLQEMQRTYTMRTGAAIDIPSKQLSEDRESNWEALLPQFRQFGVQLSDTRAERIKQGDQNQLKSLLTTLFEIDTSPMP